MCVCICLCVCIVCIYLLCFACVCSCIPERSTKSLSLHTLKMTLHRTGEDFVNVGTSASVIHTSGQWSGYMVADKVEFRDTGMDESNFALITSSTYIYISPGLGYWPMVSDH